MSRINLREGNNDAHGNKEAFSLGVNIAYAPSHLTLLPSNLEPQHCLASLGPSLHRVRPISWCHPLHPGLGYFGAQVSILWQSSPDTSSSWQRTKNVPTPGGDKPQRTSSPSRGAPEDHPDNVSTQACILTAESWSLMLPASSHLGFSF